MIRRIIPLLLVLTGLCVSAIADDRTAVETLSVFGKKELLPTRPGSAHVVTEEDLEKFEFTDIHRVLRSVPGVNLQEEDGFGLRPNIGLRGGHPHRSKKVTLMEDGVLIGPAPYSAPAAYYFPQMNKIAGVEVFKGAPSTAFGPNNIGGAINLVTRMNPPGLKASVRQGQFQSSQYDLALGIETFGDISIDINRTESQGFKKLENRDNTGFERNNVTLRWDKYFVTKDQNINLKFGWASEDSNETYAGLTEDDFQADPLKRYSATERDKMLWNHQQIFASYAITPTENLRSRVTLYRHRFDRSWDKLVGFSGTDPSNPAPEISEILNNPDFAANDYYYQVLKGNADSGFLSDDRDVIDLGNNQRQYYSQGAQFSSDYELDGFAASHLFQLGYRIHQDGISRFHESRYFNMTGGTLELNNSRPQETTVLNRGETTAHTLSLSHEMNYQALTVKSIVRAEDINYEFEDFLTATTQESGDDILAPGVGVFHQTFRNTGFLAGINKAFTPVGPGQADNVSPEEAINYELGVRHTGFVGIELIAFYSDYKNLLGTCTQSGGCTVNQLDQSFNGGKSEVLGAEFMINTDLKAGKVNFPIRFTTTYTQAQFKNGFTSALNEWGQGDVKSGDPIPYIPDWQANLLLGCEYKKWTSYISANYLGAMADQAVQAGRKTIGSRIVYGLATAYKLGSRTKLKVRLDNITNERYAVSRRPFGLRPGRPFMAFVGIESAFF